jgi:hypothetical protein
MAHRILLTHVACNLGKNRATVAEFQEWLRLVREAILAAEE